MPANDNQPAEKGTLHPRNAHRAGYDFNKLTRALPELQPFIRPNPNGIDSIDFANPEAVKVLNRALLLHFYGVKYWDIPQGYLCPPIPGRADYLHYLADLLAETNGGTMPAGNKIKALDIGVGANCVYPLVGKSVYGWDFTGTDADPAALRSANSILQLNPPLADAVKLRLQTNKANVFKGIITQGDYFDVTMCNPPFHASWQEAQAGTIKKWQNLNNTGADKTALNFGGKNSELWTPGGEVAFIRNMADQSALFADRVLWFSTLVSKKDSLQSVYRALHKAKALDIKTIQMEQGQKVSRIVAWTFMTTADQSDWRKRFWL